MAQMRRIKKMQSTKSRKRKNQGFASLSQRKKTGVGSLVQRKKHSLFPSVRRKRNACYVEVVSEKGEELTYRIDGRRGIYKIKKQGGVPYTHLKVISDLKVNSKILLYSQDGAIEGTIKKIAALESPSTDVELGAIPPIKRPGGH